MARSKKKLSFISYELLTKNLKKHSITFRQRSTRIPKTLVGKRVYIYTGKVFSAVPIKSEYIGLRLGEFVGTRRYPLHSKKKMKKSKQRNK